MKKFWILLLFLFPCKGYGADVKFIVPVNLQGNSVTNVSTMTFKYGVEYSTMSVKLDEIAVSSTDARTLHPDYKISTTSLKVNGNCWVMGLYGFEK